MFYNNSTFSCCENNRCCQKHCLNCFFEKENNKCIKCEKGYKLKGGYCGKTDCSISHCNLCNDESTQCYSCKGIYYPKNGNGKCTATDRIIGIVISCFVAVVVMIIIFCCLLNTSKFIDLTNVKSISIFRQPRNSAPIEPEKNTIELEKLKPIYEKQFLENIISFQEDYSKKKCGVCLNQNANFVLICGCCVCSEHEQLINKVLETNNNVNMEANCLSESQCPVCSKKISKDVVSITCGICFTNKKELAHFKCKCAFVVCKECFIQWKLTNSKCPACRNEI